MAIVLSRFSSFRPRETGERSSESWRVRANLISTLSLFAINTLIGFAFVGLTVQGIGAEAYATYVILSQTIGNATLVMFLFNQNATRFAGNLAQNPEAASAALNRLFTLSLIVAGLMLIGTFVAAPRVGQLIRIAPDHQQQAVWLAALTAATFTLSGATAALGSLYVQKNELWIHNLVQSASSLLRFGAIAWWAWLGKLSLLKIGAATLAATVFIAGMQGILWRVRYTDYRFSLERPSLAESWNSYLAGFHSFLNRNIETLLVTVELFLLNRLSLAVFAAYATFLPVMTAFRLYTTFLCSTFEPTWVVWQAEGRTRALCDDLNRALGKMLALVLLPGCATCLYALELTGLWLGKSGAEVGMLTERFAPLFLAITCFLPVYFFCYAVGFQRRINVASVLSVLGVAAGSVGLAWMGRLHVESFLCCMLICYGSRNLLVLPVLICKRFPDYKFPAFIFVRMACILAVFYGSMWIRSFSPIWLGEGVRGVLSLAALGTFLFTVVKSR